ncbi:MAG TPA: hypothetical protein VGP82_20435 [Ktedonobacterales bacterium]|jgi:TolA-binding protein|nr:hypothetical protein [Ktedonobacterales bacterium]
MHSKGGFRAPTRQLVWVLAVTVLVLMLALAGCTGRGAQRDNGGTTGGTGTTQQTSGGSGQGTQTGGTSSSAAQQVQTLDQQVQGISSPLDSSSQDADSDFSSQDNEVQP